MPRKLTKSGQPTEFSEQCAIISWAKANERKYPALKMLFASMGGVRLSKVAAINAKRAGNRKGVSDLILLHPSSGYAGLLIELKIKGNYPTKDQKIFLENASKCGYFSKVCYGAKEAIDVIEAYVRIAKTTKLI